MLIRRSPHLLALCLSLGLAACGGGDDDDMPMADASTPQPDGSPPAPDADLTPDADLSPQCGSFQYSAEMMCQDCMEASCCAELAACDTATPCGDLFACLSACASGDMACQQQCINDNMAGLADGQALVNCDDNCMAECTSSFPVCDSGLSTPNQACSTCLTNMCCAEMTACAGDMVCLDCITGASMTGCDMNANYMAANACLGTTCAAECM